MVGPSFCARDYTKDVIRDWVVVVLGCGKHLFAYIYLRVNAPLV